MKETIKRRLSFTLKYLVGFFLLGWILWRVDRREMLLTFTHLSLPVLAAVFGMAVLNLAAQFYRWKYLIESASNHYQPKDLIPSFFAGFAFRLMVPGGHAEITKIFLLPGKKGGKVVAFGIEKFFQTYIKFILVLIALPIVFAEYRPILWSLAVIGIGAYFLLPFLLRTNFMKRFQEKDLKYNKIFLQTVIYSFAIFICLIIQYFLLINDVYLIGFLETTLAVIFIWGSGLLPISVSGLGVRENLAAFFLAKYAIPASAAVGISMFIFFINAIIPALVGVIFIYKRRKDLSDAKGTIKTVTKNLYRQGKQRFNSKRASGFPQQEKQLRNGAPPNDESTNTKVNQKDE
jgi:uncharacterized membrane protein YbhN (UPF0104 family)